MASAVLVALVSVQQGLGEARVLAGHMPLGMTVFGGATALTYRAFTQRTSTPAPVVRSRQGVAG